MRAKTKHSFWHCSISIANIISPPGFEYGLYGFELCYLEELSWNIIKTNEITEKISFFFTRNLEKNHPGYHNLL